MNKWRIAIPGCASSFHYAGMLSTEYSVSITLPELVVSNSAAASASTCACPWIVGTRTISPTQSGHTSALIPRHCYGHYSLMKWERQHAHCVGRKHTKAARHTAHYGAASNTFSAAIVERANARDGHAQWKGNLNAGALIDKGTTAAFLRFIEFLSLLYAQDGKS